MKTKIKFQRVFIMILMVYATLFFGSCEKETDNTPKQPNFSAITDNAIAEGVFADVFNQSGKASSDAEEATNSKGFKGILTGCPTITISPFDLSWPKIITVDFGQSNCMGTDGHNRRGIINIHASGTWRTPGSITTISFTDYYLDDHKVEGTEIITNSGRNQDSNFVYVVDVQNAKVTKPDNTFILWNSQRQQEWVEGEPTILNPFDDAYLITGNVTGTSSAGDAYTIDVLTPLNVLVGCHWIRAGVIDINIQGLSTITVDYGNGTCDGYAEATYNGVSYPIIMQ